MNKKNFMRMKLSYTNSINLYPLRLSFFLISFLFIFGCQLDQSVNLIKEKLFSENAEEIQQNEKVVEEIDLKKNDDSPENLSFEDKQINKSKNEIVNEEIEAEIIKEKIKKN